MRHAFQCAGDCVRCKGRGTVGRGSRERCCKKCHGSGNCAEWRGEPAQGFPCRDPECCICGGSPCLWEGCKRCWVDGERVEECLYGACPACGGLYVDWFSYPGRCLYGLGHEPVAPEDVYLQSEHHRGIRPIPMGTVRYRRSGRKGLIID